MRLAFLSAMLLIWASIVQAGDWSGSYFGGQAEVVNLASGQTGNGARYGLHGGRDVDLGRLVLGGEVEFLRLNVTHVPSGTQLRNVGRLKFRAGHDFGPGMAYAIIGGVNGDTRAGHENGVVYGLGLLTSVGDNLRVSGEALRQVFDDFSASGADLRSDSFNVRVSFRF